MKRKNSEWPCVFDIEPIAHLIFDFLLLDQICAWIESADESCQLQLIRCTNPRRWNVEIIVTLSMRGQLKTLRRHQSHIKPPVCNFKSLLQYAQPDCLAFLMDDVWRMSIARKYDILRVWINDVSKSNFIYMSQKEDDRFWIYVMREVESMERLEWMLPLVCPKNIYEPWFAKFRTITMQLSPNFDYSECFDLAVAQHNIAAMHFFWSPVTKLGWLPFGDTSTQHLFLCDLTNQQECKCNVNMGHKKDGLEIFAQLVDDFNMPQHIILYNLNQVVDDFNMPQYVVPYPYKVSNLNEAIQFVLADMCMYPIETICGIFGECCKYGYVGLAQYIWNITNVFYRTHLVKHFEHGSQVKKEAWFEFCWNCDPTVMITLSQQKDWTRVALETDNQDLAEFLKRHHCWSVNIDRDCELLGTTKLNYGELAFTTEQFQQVLERAISVSNMNVIDFCAIHAPKTLDVLFAKHLLNFVLLCSKNAILRAGLPHNSSHKQMCYEFVVHTCDEWTMQHLLKVAPFETTKERLDFWKWCTHAHLSSKRWLFLLKSNIFSKQDIANYLLNTLLFRPVFASISFDVDFEQTPKINIAE